MDRRVGVCSRGAGEGGACQRDMMHDPQLLDLHDAMCRIGVGLGASLPPPCPPPTGRCLLQRGPDRVDGASPLSSATPLQAPVPPSATLPPPHTTSTRPALLLTFPFRLGPSCVHACRTPKAARRASCRRSCAHSWPGRAPSWPGCSLRPSPTSPSASTCTSASTSASGRELGVAVRGGIERRKAHGQPFICVCARAWAPQTTTTATCGSQRIVVVPVTKHHMRQLARGSPRQPGLVCLPRPLAGLHCVGNAAGQSGRWSVADHLPWLTCGKVPPFRGPPFSSRPPPSQPCHRTPPEAPRATHCCGLGGPTPPDPHACMAGCVRACLQAHQPDALLLHAGRHCGAGALQAGGAAGQRAAGQRAAGQRAAGQTELFFLLESLVAWCISSSSGGTGCWRRAAGGRPKGCGRVA